MKLSVVIPAYNEEKRIADSLKKIDVFLKKRKISYELIVVDDGSSDSTVQIAESSGVNLKVIKNAVNLGKGGAVRNGMLNADGDCFLLTDADLSTPIEELDNFLHWLNCGFDVVIGSRSVRGANVEVRQPFYRELIGKIFNKFVRLLTVRGLIDTQCGFKLFTKKCAREIFPLQRLNGFCFDVEVLYLAARKGYKIKELPVVWRNSQASTVRPFKDSFFMLQDLIKIRINELRGFYG